MSALHRVAAAQTGVIQLAGGLPAPELLPREALTRALAEIEPAALQYGWPEGNAELRAWIAHRLAISADDIIITAGAQQALALIADELGDTPVAVGPTTYPAALDAFRAVASAAAVHYVIRGASNPQGIDPVVPAGTLIADDAYAELRFDGRLPRGRAAFVVGTVSKTVCPGLRIGWLVPPRERFASLLARKQAADLQTGELAQHALVRLLATFDYDAALARARACYAARAQRLVVALRRHAPSLRFRDPEGGFSIWCETDVAGDELALLRCALAAGVSLDPGHIFRPRDATGPAAFRLCFSFAPMADLEEGVRRLACALADWARGLKPFTRRRLRWTPRASRRSSAT